MKRTIKTLNAISKQGLSRLPETYTVANDAADPDAILVRSSDMHKLDIPPSLLAVGRAELTLQTAVAVRDRVVAAYQDVMRMPI